MENTIGVNTVYYGSPRRSTCTADIVYCTLLKVKKNEGSYDRKAKNSKKSNMNIKNRDAPSLKITTNGLEVFVTNTFGLFLCNGCFVEHKVEAVINA